MYLRVHSQFSLGYGVCSPEQILSRASECGWDTLILTDINTTAGVADWMRLAPRYGIRPLVGLDCRSGQRRDYVLMARNNRGYEEICRRLTIFLREGGAWPCPAEPHPDLWVIYEGPRGPGHRLREGEWVGLSSRDLHRFGDLSSWVTWNKMLAMETATLLRAEDRALHRLLRAIHHNLLLSNLDSTYDQASSGDLLESSALVFERFNSCPELLYRTTRLLDECRIYFEIGSSFPHKNLSRYTGNEEMDYRFLCFLARAGIRHRYANPPAELQQRLEKELMIIRQKRYVAYFLINWKILKFARESGFFYVGRGSGANSLVAYLLFITDVDPLELDLFFERFINLYRRNPPDFDLDFSWQDRDAVLQYVFRRFPHVALLGTHVCYQHRSAVRELGKVFGLPGDEIEALSGMRGTDRGVLDRTGRLVLHYADRMQGMPSHHSIHAGGVLITDFPVERYTACFFPPKGFPTALLDMHSAEDLGFHKFDLLSQRGLAKIKDTLALMGPVRSEGMTRILRDIHRLKRNARVRSLLEQSKSVGCFYIESPAMRMLLTKLRVHNYLGLVAASSVIRPGVSSSGMMRVYIERERCPELRLEAPEALRNLLPETHGVMVYQEDVIRVAHVLGGLNLAEADVLRRSMSGKHRGLTELQDLEQRFVSGAVGLGHGEVLARELWRQMAGFAGYAFAKGHSASYAVESYQCLYLKAYAPLAYMVAVLNNGGGFYSAEEYLEEARRLGAVVEGPCVQYSTAAVSLEGSCLRLGLAWIRGLEERSVQSVLKARSNGGLYHSVEDFCRRSGLGLEQSLLLWRVGALRCLQPTRSLALWALRLFYSSGVQGSRSGSVSSVLFEAEPIQPFVLPSAVQGSVDGVGSLPLDRIRQAYDEMELLGFPLVSPFDLVDRSGYGSPLAWDATIPTGTVVSLDLYTVHIRTVRTVRGERMAFGTWRDPSGSWVDTVHFPPQWKSWPWKGRGIYRLSGILREEYDYRFVEVSSMHKRAYVSLESASFAA